MEIFIFILIMHFISDFIFQDEKWALNKSKELKQLLKHTIMYSFLWVIPTWFFTGSIFYAFLFSFITFVFHTIIDFITSKIVKRKFESGHTGSSIPNLGAFTVIGFDQLLHYIQLLLTWKLIFGI